jgi:drug/metabolite transporter (DMT)-like permease
VLAIVLGLSGAAVVLGFEAGLPLPGSLGDWLGLLSGIIFALSVTVARKAPEVSGLDRTFVSFACAALVAVPMALATGPGPSGDAMVHALPLAAAVGLLWVLPGTWLLLWGAAHLDPGRVSILLMLEVIAASVSASLLTDEPFGWREAAGCALILSAGLVEAAPDLRNRRA